MAAALILKSTASATMSQVLKHFSCFSVLLIFLTVVDTKAESCTTNCKILVNDSTCWENARRFFIHQLVKSLNDYAEAEILIAKWREKHNVELSVSEINSSISTLLDAAKDASGGPLKENELSDILKTIANRTLERAHENPAAIETNLSCPVPCDYTHHLWVYLFICSCIVIVLAIPVMLLHIRHTRRNFIKYQLT